MTLWHLAGLSYDRDAVEDLAISDCGCVTDVFEFCSATYRFCRRHLP